MTHHQKTYPQQLAAMPLGSLTGLDRAIAATARPKQTVRKFSTHSAMLAAMPEGSLTGLDRAMAAAFRRAHTTA